MHVWTPWHKPDVDKEVSLHYTPGSVMGHEDDNVVFAMVDGQKIADVAQANAVKNKVRALMLARNALFNALSDAQASKYTLVVQWDANQVVFSSTDANALAVFTAGSWSPLVVNV